MTDLKQMKAELERLHTLHQIRLVLGSGADPALTLANQYAEVVDRLVPVAQKHKEKAERANFTACGCDYCEALTELGKDTR